MTFTQNFPFFCIILSMFAAIISFVLPAKAAKYVHLIMTSLVLILSAHTLAFVCRTGESYTFMMGHFPAPWGNEIRIGPLEALMALFFSILMLLSVLGGIVHIDREIQESKQNLFFIVMDLQMSSLLALIYTNDLFTAYVFIEICTISACGLILSKKEGRNFVSALRYMVMNQVGSGLFLIGLSLLYSITGHLLMSPAREALDLLVPRHTFDVPVLVILILMTIGLSVKSGLYPFHTWIPDAYAYSTPAASSVLSSLVSKGYLFLLIKLFFRVLDFESVTSMRMVDILFIFGLLGMIMGSVDAIREDNIRRMTAFSSVAQIGYIYMGLGLGTTAGVTAALFHIISHGAMKALLFLCIPGLTEASEGHSDFQGLTGAGFRHKIAGIGFTIGALAMIGMPLTTGFVSKYMFAASATSALRPKMLAAWVVLAISTTLNAVYFMRTVLILYTSVEEDRRKPIPEASSPVENAAILGLVFLNLFLGVMSPPVLAVIESGLSVFG